MENNWKVKLKKIWYIPLIIMILIGSGAGMLLNKNTQEKTPRIQVDEFIEAGMALKNGTVFDKDVWINHSWPTKYIGLSGNRECNGSVCIVERSLTLECINGNFRSEYFESDDLGRVNFTKITCE